MDQMLPSLDSPAIARRSQSNNDVLLPGAYPSIPDSAPRASPIRRSITDSLFEMSVNGIRGLPSRIIPISGRNSARTSRVTGDPVDWTWEEVLQYASQFNQHLNFREKLTGFISKEKVTGRSLIDIEEEGLAYLVRNDIELLPDLQYLIMKLRNKARHFTPVSPRSPTLRTLFADTDMTEAHPASPQSHTSTRDDNYVQLNVDTSEIPRSLSAANLRSGDVRQTAGDEATQDHRHTNTILDPLSSMSHAGEMSASNVEAENPSSVPRPGGNALDDDDRSREVAVTGRFWLPADGDVHALA